MENNVTKQQKTAINSFVRYHKGDKKAKGLTEFKDVVEEEKFEEQLSGWIKSMLQSGLKPEYVDTQKSALSTFFSQHTEFEFGTIFESSKLQRAINKYKKQQAIDHPDSLNKRGKNATDPFNDRDVVRIAKYLLRNNDIFLFVFTSALLNIGCRPEDFKLVSFENATLADVSSHRFFIRTDYNKSRWLPNRLVVYPNLCELTISWPVALSIALTKIDENLELEGANFVDVLSKSLEYNVGSIKSDFKSVVNRALVDSARLSLYSYRKYCLTYTGNNTIMFNVGPYVSARVGHTRIDHFSADKSTKNWIQSNDMDSHYRGLTEVGDTIVAKVAAWRHPHATSSRDYMIDFVKSVKEEWFEVFPDNVRRYFQKDQLEMHLKYLLIAKSMGIYNCDKLPVLEELVKLPKLPPPNFEVPYDVQKLSPFIYGPLEFYVDKQGNLCKIKYESIIKTETMLKPMKNKARKKATVTVDVETDSEVGIESEVDFESESEAELETSSSEPDSDRKYSKVLDSESESESELELLPETKRDFDVDEFLDNDDNCINLKDALNIPKKGLGWNEKCDLVVRQWFDGNLVPELPPLCDLTFNWAVAAKKYEAQSLKSQVCAKVNKRKKQAENVKKCGAEQCFQYVKNKYNTNPTMEKLSQSKII